MAMSSNAVIQNSKFKLLVDRLEKDFGPDHKVVHYIGAVLPQHTTVKDTFTVSELRKEHVAAQFNACSTLYVPPLKSEKAVDRDVLQKVMGVGKDTVAGLQIVYPVPQWDADFKTGAVPAYGPYEQGVIASLTTHTVPASHCPVKGSPAMQQLMIDLALRSTLQAKYKANPKAVIDMTPGLTDLEKAALQLRTPGAITAVMKPRPGENITADNLKDYVAAAADFTIIVVILLPSVNA